MQKKSKFFKSNERRREPGIGSLVDTSPSVLPLFDKSLLNQPTRQQDAFAHMIPWHKARLLGELARIPWLREKLRKLRRIELGILHS